MLRLITLALGLSLALPAAGQQCGTSLVEGFDGFSNLGAWGWNGTYQASISSDGNPAWHLRSQDFDADLPRLRTQLVSVFGGDWRARGVTSAGIDLRAFQLDPAQCGRPVSLRLSNDAMTPGNPFDDPTVLFVSGERIPCKDASWHSYTVDVPSQSTTLPPGWIVESSGGLPPAQVWDRVVRNVSAIQWLLGDPAQPYPTTTWQLGADNARLAFAGGPTTYCVAQPNSASCSPALIWAGTPSASLPVHFVVRAEQVLAQVPGLCFYGFAPDHKPALGGTLCVAAPLQRTAPRPSGGTGACDGSLAVDFNLLIQSGADPRLVAGATVFAQVWSRDPAAPSGSSLTNALRFSICP